MDATSPLGPLPSWPERVHAGTRRAAAESRPAARARWPQTRRFGSHARRPPPARSGPGASRWNRTRPSRLAPSGPPRPTRRARAERLQWRGRSGRAHARSRAGARPAPAPAGPRARGAAGLANLGRVDAVDAQPDTGAAARREHPDRVAVNHVADPRRPTAAVAGSAGAFLRVGSRQQHARKHGSAKQPVWGPGLAVAGILMAIHVHARHRRRPRALARCAAKPAGLSPTQQHPAPPNPTLRPGSAQRA